MVVKSSSSHSKELDRSRESMMAEAAIANDNGTAEYAGNDKLDNPPTCSVACQGEDAAGCEFESTLPPVATDPHDENYVKKLLSKLKRLDFT